MPSYSENNMQSQSQFTGRSVRSWQNGQGKLHEQVCWTQYVIKMLSMSTTVQTNSMGIRMNIRFCVKRRQTNCGVWSVNILKNDCQKEPAEFDSSFAINQVVALISLFTLSHTEVLAYLLSDGSYCRCLGVFSSLSLFF